MLDQNFLFMAFLMLCFAGLATMFYFMMRNIDELARVLKDDRNQMQTNLRALESSLNHLADLLTRLTADQNAPRNASAAQREAMRPMSVDDLIRPSSGMSGAGMSPSASMASPLPGQAEMRISPRPAAPAQGAAPAGGMGAGVSRPASQAFSPLAFADKDELEIAGPLTPPTPAQPGPPAPPCPPSGDAASGAASMPSLSMNGETSRRKR